MKSIPIFVVNLERSPERLAYICEQFDNIGRQFNRVDAVDGVKLADGELLQRQQESKRSNKHYATLNPGEIGCAMSWHKVWKILSDSDNTSLIGIEDDVELLGNFTTVVDALSENMDNMIVDLWGERGFWARERKIVNGIKLVRYHVPHTGTIAKIYSKGAVRSFQLNIQHFEAPIDTLQQMTWLHDIHIWSLEKGCVSNQDAQVGGSIIQSRNKKLTSKLKKEFGRPLWRLYIIIRNLFV